MNLKNNSTISSIFAKYKDYFELDLDLKLDDNLYMDLDVFKDNIGLMDKLNHNITVFGKEYFRNTLLYPQKNYNFYQEKYLLFMKLSQPEINEINSLFSEIKSRQNDIIWFWQEKTKAENELINQVLFKKNNYYDLNQHQSIVISYFSSRLYLQPVYSLLSPTLSIIIPFIILKYQFKLPIGLDVYLKIIRIFLPNSLKLGFGPVTFSGKTTLCILFLFLYLYSFYNLVIDIIRLLNINHIIYKKLESIKILLINLKKLCAHLGEIFPSYEPYWTNKMCLLQKNYFGNNIYQYYNLTENHKKTVEQYIILLGKLDHLFAIWKYIENVKQIGYPICHSKFNNDSDINLEIMDLWNINLYGLSPVLNSIKLGGNGKKNLIVTGPNAGGKTTFLKGIFINILLSSLYGFSLSSRYYSSDFNYLFSHINKFDKISEFSLFQSEIKHFSTILQNIKKYPIYFGILDELFTSTTPEEGASCAYAISEKLGSESGMIIVTTHFRILSELETTSSSFFNVSMGYHNNNFTYLVENGSNHIHLALDLLNSNKNTNQVYHNALKILDKIINR